MENNFCSLKTSCDLARVTDARQLGLTPDGTEVWVTNEFGHSVTVISTETNIVLKTIMVGNSPSALGNFFSLMLLLDKFPHFHCLVIGQTHKINPTGEA